MGGRDGRLCSQQRHRREKMKKMHRRERHRSGDAGKTGGECRRREERCMFIVYVKLRQTDSSTMKQSVKVTLNPVPKRELKT